jgi:hypothetical protein
MVLNTLNVVIDQSGRRVRLIPFLLYESNLTGKIDFPAHGHDHGFFTSIM